MYSVLLQNKRLSNPVSHCVPAPAWHVMSLRAWWGFFSPRILSLRCWQVKVRLFSKWLPRGRATSWISAELFLPFACSFFSLLLVCTAGAESGDREPVRKATTHPYAAAAGRCGRSDRRHAIYHNTIASARSQWNMGCSGPIGSSIWT